MKTWQVMIISPFKDKWKYKPTLEEQQEDRLKVEERLSSTKKCIHLKTLIKVGEINVPDTNVSMKEDVLPTLKEIVAKYGAGRYMIRNCFKGNYPYYYFFNAESIDEIKFIEKKGRECKNTLSPK